MSKIKKWKPVCSNVMVKMIKMKEMAGGISVPEKDIREGKVVAVGDGTPTWPEMKCKVGDTVRWKRHAGDVLPDNEHIFLNEEKQEILAILGEDEY